MRDAERRTQLEVLFRDHAAAVRAYARRRVDPAAADDAVSEVFVVAWRRLEDVPADALPWLLGCARNVLLHQRRRTRRDLALHDRLVAAEPRDPVAGSDRGLALALGQLSDGDRELLLLVAWEGLEPAQAARVLGCSRNTLGVRLHRARRRLAAALTTLDADDPPRPQPQAEEAI